MNVWILVQAERGHGRFVRGVFATREAIEAEIKVICEEYPHLARRDFVTQVERVQGDLHPVFQLFSDVPSSNRAFDIDTVTALRNALTPFASGGEWGRVKAWIVEGAPIRDEGIKRAAEITKWQVLVDRVLHATPRN